MDMSKIEIVVVTTALQRVYRFSVSTDHDLFHLMLVVSLLDYLRCNLLGVLIYVK
jgi:hypothetical protein